MIKDKSVFSVKAASKSFHASHGKLALNNVNIEIQQGEFVVLLGASGSGKSTLLRTLCGLERLSNIGSQVHLLGAVLQQDGKLSKDIRSLRRKTAIIFQQFNLVGRISLFGNVLTGNLSRMPLWRAVIGRYTSQERISALQAMDSVGLIEYRQQRVSTLSGGQQQRAAIAKALVQNPEVLLADEPVASLDPESTERVMGLLMQLNQQKGLTIVISLHDVNLAKRYCSRVVALKNGSVIFDGHCNALNDSILDDLYGAQAVSALNESEYVLGNPRNMGYGNPALAAAA